MWLCFLLNPLQKELSILVYTARLYYSNWPWLHLVPGSSQSTQCAKWRWVSMKTSNLFDWSAWPAWGLHSTSQIYLKGTNPGSKGAEPNNSRHKHHRFWNLEKDLFEICVLSHSGGFIRLYLCLLMFVAATSPLLMGAYRGISEPESVKSRYSFTPTKQQWSNSRNKCSTLDDTWENKVANHSC